MCLWVMDKRHATIPEKIRQNGDVFLVTDAVLDGKLKDVKVENNVKIMNI